MRKAQRIELEAYDGIERFCYALCFMRFAPGRVLVSESECEDLGSEAASVLFLSQGRHLFSSFLTMAVSCKTLVVARSLLAGRPVPVSRLMSRVQRASRCPLPLHSTARPQRYFRTQALNTDKTVLAVKAWVKHNEVCLTLVEKTSFPKQILTS